MFVEISFPLSLRKTFTYSVPTDLLSAAKFGVRAVAPLGNRTLTGFITRVLESTTVKEKIKNIYDVIDETPIIDETELKFYEWLADYYMCSVGEALKLTTPYGTEIQSKKKILSDTNFCKKLIEQEKKKNTTRYKLLFALSENNIHSFAHLQKIVGKKNIYANINTLINEGAITAHTEVEPAKVKAKKQKFIRLAKPLEDVYELIPELERKSPKQLELLLKLIQKKNEDTLLSKILSENNASKTSVDALVKKGIVLVFEKQIERKYVENYAEEEVNFSLTVTQKKVIEEVSAKILENCFKPFLLHGVTGSGKTQVYIELVKEVLTLNKTAIILVPEISLTPQITSRLLNSFGDNVSLLHSRMSLGERFDSWYKILIGKSKVVVGARSALFSPIKNLGLIVVDEEHDSSYKQDDHPKYNGRDSAIVKAMYSNCPIILGSATPSVESMYNAMLNKYKLLSLPERVDGANLPTIKLINTIEEKKNNRMENIFSKTLLEEIDIRLQKKEGVIILQNRRGFATQIYCIDCGQIEACDNCSVSMVYHINKNILHCHYCDLTKNVPQHCTYCGSQHLKYFGTGTERVEDELTYYFPEAIIERIDSDSISKKGTLSNLLYKFKNGEIDILVGTQMVSKGLDFSRVTLVGVVSAETSLWFPDFRADERTFQLLTQVAGRSGRSKAAGEVLIQTQNDKHFVLQKVLHNDYDGFFKKELLDREKMAFPPFSRLCLIEIKDKDDEKAKGAISDFFNEVKAYKKQINISGPSTAIIARLKGEYRYQILLKSLRASDPGGKILRKVITESFANFSHKSNYKNIFISFDIDPQSII